MAKELSRWDPFRDLVAMRGDLNRLFERAFGEDGRTFVGHWRPALDMHETSDAYVLRFDLPGCTSEDVTVTFDQNLLTIQGQRRGDEQVKEEQYHRVERWYGTFQRTISLPSTVDADGIQAHFGDGVLEVTVPKLEQAKPRRIKISESAAQISA